MGDQQREARVDEERGDQRGGDEDVDDARKGGELSVDPTGFCLGVPKLFSVEDGGARVP